MTDSKTVQKNCAACAEIITVRLADHKRGWGRFCDKACAAAYKCGQRPGDVNAGHTQSEWAMRKLAERRELHNGDRAPKAPSIKAQLGRKTKVRKTYHSPAQCRDCGVPINGPGWCRQCSTEREAINAMEEGWDGHKGHFHDR